MEKLALGRAQFMNQPAERRKLEFDFVQTDFQAILGLDFLIRNACLIDLEGHRLYVRSEKPSTETSKALAETLQRSGFTNAALRGDYYLTVDAQINNQPVRLLVDTGAGVSLLDQTEVKRLGLQTVKENHTGSLIPDEDMHAVAV